MKKKSLLTLASMLTAMLMGIAGVSRAQDADAIQEKPLPQVLIIGDSISGGYHKTVVRLLEGKADVTRIPCNGEYMGTGVKKIDEWLGDTKWDVIHFNWGLWDIYGWEYAKVDRSPAKYEERLETLVTRLEKTGAKLIWGTTTPGCPELEVSMRDRFHSNLVITSEVQQQYREVALRVMKKHNIPFNDLYSLILPDLEKYSPAPDNVHFTGAGYGVLGKQVADAILQQIETMDKE